MEIFCTRPGCPRPLNQFSDLDSGNTLKTVQQKFCVTCGMPLLLSGRYLPQKQLGQGGFGTAFLARDRYTPNLRTCVVKLFQPTGKLTAAQLQTAQVLFEREAAVLEEIGNHHPQIPDLYAFFSLEVPALQPGKQDEYFYLVQEFIDGQNLEEQLAERGAFPEAEVREILVSLLQVLGFVHEHGTIHRDIKPSNIMRNRAGRLFLLDFGAVKQVAAGGPDVKSTGIYSMGYAPPEQMSGGTVYPSTDFYALAVTCISLLTGRPPEDLYDGYSNSWKWESYAPQNTTLAPVLNRMLAAAPQQRYDSAAAALAALAPPPVAPPPVAPPPVAPPPVASPPSTPKPASVSTPTPAASTSLQAAAVTPPPLASTGSSSLLSFLGGALFTGVEGSLLAIASLSLLGTTWLGSGAWLLLLAGLIVLQLRRVIERVDLIIVALVTTAVILWFPPLRSVLEATGGSPVQTVLAIALLAGLMVVAIATLFRLLYQLFSRNP